MNVWREFEEIEELPKNLRDDFENGFFAACVRLKDEIEELTKQRDELKANNEILRDRELKTAWMHHREIVAQQSAYIEMKNGAGCDAAMQWIINGLFQKGLLPSCSESDSAQQFYDENIEKSAGHANRALSTKRKG